MAIDWTEELATGINEIDNQHKELFVKINNLLEACHQRHGRDEVNKVIKFLEDYVISHFSEEEKYMIKYDYPKYLSHKKQHFDFMENFFTLKKIFEADGPGVSVVVGINHLVVEWWGNHILKLDKELGNFLKVKI